MERYKSTGRSYNAALPWTTGPLSGCREKTCGLPKNGGIKAHGTERKIITQTGPPKSGPQKKMGFLKQSEQLWLKADGVVKNIDVDTQDEDQF